MAFVDLLRKAEHQSENRRQRCEAFPKEIRRESSQTQSSNALGYANFFSRSHDAVIRLYDVSRTFHERKELHFLPRFLAAR